MQIESSAAGSPSHAPVSAAALRAARSIISIADWPLAGGVSKSLTWPEPTRMGVRGSIMDLSLLQMVKILSSTGQQITPEEFRVLGHRKMSHALHHFEMGGVGQFGDLAAHFRGGGRVVLAAQQVKRTGAVLQPVGQTVAQIAVFEVVADVAQGRCRARSACNATSSPSVPRAAIAGRSSLPSTRRASLPP